MSEAVLEIKNLTKHFPVKKGLFRRTVGYVKAVDGVTFTINKSETLGLIGESGCGKTTVGKLIMQLIKPDSGEIVIDGKHVGSLSRKELHEARQGFQMVFQDPYGSLDPTKSILSVLAEPIKEYNLLPKEKIYDRACELIKQVGLNEYDLQKYPHEFSGGQRQRIVVARALAMQPKIIVCDEPVSALDVSIQAQILNLLVGLQKEFELTYIFISHALPSVKHVSTHVAVMYLGRIVEYAKTEDIFSHPRHPYTEGLMSAVPIPDPSLRDKRPKEILEGDLPSPAAPPPGCHFHTRCRYATEECSKIPPKMCEVEPGHFCACHHPLKDAVGTVLKK